MAKDYDIVLKDTKFIYNTNLAGDPRRSRFGSTQRTAAVIIPDPNTARELMDAGIDVKMTSPRAGEEDGFVPRYFVNIKLNYKSKVPPKVYLVTDTGKVLLDEDTIGQVDDMRVQCVRVALNAWTNPNNPNAKPSLYVQRMNIIQYVEDDPFADLDPDVIVTAAQPSMFMANVSSDDDLPF